MANYLASVELRAAAPEDYERLRQSMRQRGFLSEIIGEDGATYQLPAGTYLVSGSSAMLHVALSAAADAANETGKPAAVIVTDWHSARWTGLAKS